MWRGDDEHGKRSLSIYTCSTLACQACRLCHSQILSESIPLVLRLKRPSLLCSLSSIARGHDHRKGVKKLIKHDSRWAHFNIDQGHGRQGLNMPTGEIHNHTQAIHHNLAAVLDIKGQRRPHPKHKELPWHHQRSLALSLSAYDCRRTLFSGHLSQHKGKVSETEPLLNVEIFPHYHAGKWKTKTEALSYSYENSRFSPMKKTEKVHWFNNVVVY